MARALELKLEDGVLPSFRGSRPCWLRPSGMTALLQDPGI